MSHARIGHRKILRVNDLKIFSLQEEVPWTHPSFIDFQISADTFPIHTPPDEHLQVVIERRQQDVVSDTDTDVDH